MNIITHALVPVLLTSTAARKSGWPGRRGLWCVGVAGAMPDLLNPHLSLEARMTSWSHGLPFWCVASLVLLAAALLARGRFRVLLALVCSGAYLPHMACDAISGGINWIYPLGTAIWGEYRVNPYWWVPLDFGCLLICDFRFRAIPRWLQSLRAKRAGSGNRQEASCRPLRRFSSRHGMASD